ncbi:MAG: acyl-CoA carboxylase subunit beta [Planctomycetes bacterium]|nr:acyl-CoA carboxylase subunit beta [Planctomycetota bacterium]
MTSPEELKSRQRAALAGNVRYRSKLAEQKKLFCRERISKLLDPGSPFSEDGLLVNSNADDLPADGVVTGIGRIHGRPVAIMANDSTVKAGSWGARTVEKILRIQELAERKSIPLFYLVDSAGARITDQIDMFPGRRHAGRIFYNEVRLSGHVPQVCILFGPSAAGGAYIPAFCDIVIMVDGNASMYLGSPRMAEMVIGQKVTLEEMGGARMHCTVSGCGDVLVADEDAAIVKAREYFQYFGQSWHQKGPRIEPRAPVEREKPLEALLPSNMNQPFDMMEVVHRIIDANSWFEMKEKFAGEILTGFARIDGEAVGIVANQPKVKGGVLFVDSADKAARFIWLCDAFGIPLLFLADVPGFMIGTAVERQGIIRAGAKMVMAVSEATVPKICVVVRKAYGAGLYAMCGPAFSPDVTIALPTASIAVMGPEAAVNAVFANKIAEQPESERAAYIEKLREEYKSDIDIMKLASENIIDMIVEPSALRGELIERFAVTHVRNFPVVKRRSVPPM